MFSKESGIGKKETPLKIIDLSTTEMQIIEFIAALRYYETSSKGTERKQSNLDSLQMGVDGVMSEYAVAKHHNIHFDINCDYRKFGADLIGRDGKKIDVKSTRREGGNLNAVKWSVDKPADFYVLTEIVTNEYENKVKLIGYIKSENFLIPENLKDVGNGEFYSLPQFKLNHYG